MQEIDLNRIIKQSFHIKNGFGYKIPDPPKAVIRVSNKRPFDGFGIYKDCWFWESKLIKSEYSSFNFSIIKEHQLKNLTLISNLDLPNVYPVITLGYYIPNKLFRIFTFHISCINQAIDSGEKSFKKKQIKNLVEKNLYVDIKNQFLDIDILKEKIIYEVSC